MKALTIRQPWASLIAAGVKTIETRSWSTKYRGPLAIHAGKHKPERVAGYLLAPPEADLGWRAQRWSGEGRVFAEMTENIHLPLGAVVATCTLAHVIPMIELADEPPRSGGFVYVDPDFIQVHDDTDDSAPRYLEAERHLGIYGSGRYAWLLTDITPCDPVPAKGRQGLWNWEAPT